MAGLRPSHDYLTAGLQFFRRHFQTFGYECAGSQTVTDPRTTGDVIIIVAFGKLSSLVAFSVYSRQILAMTAANLSHMHVIDASSEERR